MLDKENFEMMEKKTPECYFKRNLIPLIEQTLDEKLSGFMERHLMTCSTCLEQRTKYQHFLVTLSQSIPRVNIQQEYWQEINSELEQSFQHYCYMEKKLASPFQMDLKEKLKNWFFKSDFLATVASVLFISLVVILVISLK